MWGDVFYMGSCGQKVRCYRFSPLNQYKPPLIRLKQMRVGFTWAPCFTLKELRLGFGQNQLDLKLQMRWLQSLNTMI